MTREEAITILKEGKLFRMWDTQEQDEEALRMAIEALQDDWIPVSEGLPEELEEVLVCVAHDGKSKMVVSCRRDYNLWDGLGRDIIGNMAWKPLPEPYKGGDDNG